MMTDRCTSPRKFSRYAYRVVLVAVVLAGLFFRCGGLFRGLNERGYVYHPDAPKQVQALGRFLDGRYVTYVGNWFYDGYPYGLNHVDELILRPVFGVRDGVAALLSPGTPVSSHRWSLYHWVRLLRVFYGMICIGLVYASCRCLGLSRKAVLFAVSAVSLSPLAISVAHTGTGDIGVDLFVSLAMVMLSLHVLRPKSILPILGVAFFCGLAFSCKYQGILALMWLGIVLLVEAIRTRNVVRMLLHGMASIPAVILGVLALKPDLVIDFKPAWENMLNNFVKIKHYNVSPAFEALPFAERMKMSWGYNLPRLSGAFYVIMLLLAGFAVLFFVVRLFLMIRRRSPKDMPSFYQSTTGLALCTFPFLVMLLAVSGKPKLHPFHFSFVVPVLAVSAAMLLSEVEKYVVRRRWHAAVYVPAVLVVMLMVGDARRDHFFWTRDDSKWVADTFSKTVLETPFRGEDKRGIKSLELEPESPSVFRNRHLWSVGRAPGLSYMKEHLSLPLPTVPYPLEADFIFCNGPVFLRNDRAFRISRNRIERRDLVFTNQVESITLGLRSGERPVAVTIRKPETVALAVLPPHSQRIVSVKAGKWIRSASRDRSSPVWILPLEVLSGAGSCWVTILEQDADVQRFLVFGGQAVQYPASMVEGHDQPNVENAVSGMRFYEWLDFKIAKQHVLKADLPAGRYVFKAQVLTGQAGSMTISMQGSGKLHHWEGEIRQIELKPGLNDVRFSFSKPFAPFETKLIFNGIENDILPISCTLKPDVDGLFNDFKEWEKGSMPVWAATPTAETFDEASNGARVRQIQFGAVLKMANLHVPDTVFRGAPLYLRMQSGLPNRTLRQIEEFNLFINLFDGNGAQRYSASVPMAAAFGEGVSVQGLGFALPTDMEPGSYTVKLGLWNSRLRLRIRSRSEWWLGKHGYSEVPVGKITVQ